MADYPRAARWDTAAVLAGVALATGVELADEGSCGTGQIGAAYVRWPDGHRSVLTCGPPGARAGRARADRQLAQASAPVRFACWAHMSLRLVDWSIRELDAAAIDIWTAVAEDLRATAC